MTPRMALALLATAAAGPAWAAGPVARHLNKPDAWFTSDEGRRVADNVLSHQAEEGGWPKNTDTTRPFTGDRKNLKPTFDNAATTDEIRLLARSFAATGDVRYRKAAERGVDYVLKAQYPSGGWPQFHPPPATSYHRHITLNDGAMVRLLQLCREVTKSDRFRFLGDDRRKSAAAAFDRGIDCLLKCQVKVDGKPTVWVRAQHDEKDLRPRSGRTYELASLSGAESVGVVELLMSIEHPSPEVVRAVEGAAAWFEAAKLTGIRQTVVNDPKAPRGRNKVIVADPSAPPLWARFYEIGTNRPLFSDRDGVPKHALADIGYERRNGYAWYGTWPARLLREDYPAWKKRVAGGK